MNEPVDAFSGSFRTAMGGSFVSRRGEAKELGVLLPKGRVRVANNESVFDAALTTDGDRNCCGGVGGRRRRSRTSMDSSARLSRIFNDEERFDRDR